MKINKPDQTGQEEEDQSSMKWIKYIKTGLGIVLIITACFSIYQFFYLNPSIDKEWPIFRIVFLNTLSLV